MLCMHLDTEYLLVPHQVFKNNESTMDKVMILIWDFEYDFYFFLIWLEDRGGGYLSNDDDDTDTLFMIDGDGDKTIIK